MKLTALKKSRFGKNHFSKNIFGLPLKASKLRKVTTFSKNIGSFLKRKNHPTDTKF